MKSFGWPRCLHRMSRCWSDRSAWKTSKATSRSDVHLQVERLEDRLTPSSFTVVNANATGTGSLAWAVAQADADTSGAAVIQFDASAFATDRTIAPGAALDLHAGRAGETIEIDGPKAGVTISGSGSRLSQFSVFKVESNTTATLNGLTITRGNAALGGAIDNLGTLTVTGSTLIGNAATFYGGAIENDGTLTLAASTLTGNAAGGPSGYGGSIDNFGPLTVTGTTFSGSIASYGGAICNVSALTVAGSTFSGNTAAADGGAVLNSSGGQATIINSTFSGNTAATGGAVENSFYCTLKITNSTLSGNSATGVYGGGGLYNWSGAIPNSGSATLLNTIVAGNTSTFGGRDLGGYNVSASSSHDLIGTGGSDGLINGVNGNLVGVANPGLAPLGNYGGPTKTFGLLPGSPALNAGSNTLAVDAQGHALATDQRGHARVAAGTVDIGAFEGQLLLVTSTSNDVAIAGSLPWAVKQANLDQSGTGVTIGFAAAAGQTFAVTRTITLAGTLDLFNRCAGESIEIDGSNTGVTIAGGSSTSTVLFSDITVDFGTTATLNNLTIVNGHASEGGGILNAYGLLTVTNCTISGNVAATVGGGICSTGSLTIVGGSISGNLAGTAGGGIYNDQFGAVTITASTITLNSAPTSPNYGFAGPANLSKNGPYWLQLNLSDAPLASLLMQQYARDGALTRADVLSAFAEVEQDGAVSVAEVFSLQKLVAEGPVLGMPDYVVNLANKLVNGDPANQLYQDQKLGNLLPSNSVVVLQKLVDKWFLGLDHPDTGILGGGLQPPVPANMPYTAFSSVPLFVNGISYADVEQSAVGDCGLIASLSEVAARLPSAIQNMFSANGDGTYTVRLYHNGVADYVTVDASLATVPGLNGYTVFDQVSHQNLDGSTSQELWVALAEKAFAQETASGWLAPVTGGVNSYSSLVGFNPVKALSAITGLPASDVVVAPGGNYGATLSQAMQQGKLVVLTTGVTVQDTEDIVAQHAYALISYTPSATQPFTLFNPWGLASEAAPIVVTADAAFLQANFGSDFIVAPQASPQTRVNGDGSALASPQLFAWNWASPVGADPAVLRPTTGTLETTESTGAGGFPRLHGTASSHDGASDLFFAVERFDWLFAY